MIDHAVSRNNVKIRLTEERWFNIIESHDYMSGLSDAILEIINHPEEIIEGGKRELIISKSLITSISLSYIEKLMTKTAL